MAYLEPYLTSSSLGKLNLSGVEVSIVHQNNLKEPNFPSKFTSGEVIGSVDFMGWKNLKVDMNGVFDEKVTPKVSSLLAFARETGSVYFYDPIFFSTIQKINIGDVTMSRNVSNGLYQTSSDQIKGSIVNYKITAVLTE